MKRGTTQHPKMTALMKALAIPRYQAVGIVESLIHFTGLYARLGDVGRWSDEQIAEGIDFPTKRATELVSSLTGSGWLDRHPDPSIRFTVHDWSEHADDAVKKWVKRACKDFVSGHVATNPDMSGNVTPARALCQSQSLTACDEAKKPATPPPVPVLLFPCAGSGPKEWPLHASKIEEYKTSFPALDILAECRIARQWEIDNPAKRKTFGGHPAFLSRWLSGSQDRAGRMQSGQPAAIRSGRLPEAQVALSKPATINADQRRREREQFEREGLL